MDIFLSIVMGFLIMAFLVETMILIGIFYGKNIEPDQPKSGIFSRTVVGMFIFLTAVVLVLDIMFPESFTDIKIGILTGFASGLTVLMFQKGLEAAESPEN
jgi:RsiW-degrading membrane proteinase PrsW (M82 family)